MAVLTNSVVSRVVTWRIWGEPDVSEEHIDYIFRLLLLVSYFSIVKIEAICSSENSGSNYN
jgi:hypothetical protein